MKMKTENTNKTKYIRKDVFKLDWTELGKEKCATFSSSREMVWMLKHVTSRSPEAKVKVTRIVDQNIDVYYVIKEGAIKYVKEK